MDKKSLENLEEQLETLSEQISYQNGVLNEIKEILGEFKRFPLYVIAGFFGWFLVEKMWHFLFGS
ncbi:hypothetical protein HYW46_03015 [Candidatus Daviesbacteria bacterium]|nr:hypothetical protein [Candidatus Daviesbacteria bacterium]